MARAEAVLDSIECPSCGEAIPISETIYHQVAERAERDLRAKSLQQERVLAGREKQLQAREGAFDRLVQEQVKAATAELKSQAEQRARQSVLLELEDLRRQAAESEPRRPLISTESGHPIRAKAATDSDRRRPPCG